MRKKVGMIYTLSRAQADLIPEAELDKMVWSYVDEMVKAHVSKIGGALCGKILHLKEEYPEVRTSAPALAPNQGLMVDGRAWAFVKVEP